MAYKELTTKKPFIVNKNLGSAVEVEPEELTRTNADGIPVSVPTQKQKYDFDRNGWLLIPSVLSNADIPGDVRILSTSSGITRTHSRTRTLYTWRSATKNSLTILLLLDSLTNFWHIHRQRVKTATAFGWKKQPDFLVGQYHPLKLNPFFRRETAYSAYPVILISTDVCRDAAGSGLTRALWELTEVTAETNNIRFIAGSHKAAYPIPELVQNPNSPLWETYACPPGSVILFTESLTQTQVESNDTARTCISNLYNTVASRWSNWLPHPQLLEAMPPKRQTLFREAYAGGNVINGDFNQRTSAYPAEI